MKRWHRFVWAAFIIGILLGLYANDRRDRERLEVYETNRQLEEAREQVRAMQVRLAELEALLLNLQEMEQITSEALPSRGRRVTVLTMPLATPSGFTAERLDLTLEGTALAGLGQAFCRAEKKHGISGVILAAICAHESGWGTSRLARERNNLAGLGAYGPGLGMAFESRADCIDYLARLLAGRPGTLTEVGAWYAEDPGWAAKVAACMKIIAEAER